MNYFIDWLEIEQDFGIDIPSEVLRSIFDFGLIGIHLDTGEIQSGIKTGKYRHKGSYCDEVDIKISGSVIRMGGNPSRWGRVENVFGFDTVDSCVSCFNSILSSLKLPIFTRCTEIFYRQDEDGSKVSKFSNGAIIKRLDITTNKAVYLQRENLCYWGISDFSVLENLQKEFTDMYKKLNVSEIKLETIAEQLVSNGVVDSLRKANTSAFYAMRWSSGEDLSNLSSATFKRHRANLRKIGIDIANPCDVEKFQAVRVISCENIVVRPFKAPDFYQFPSNAPQLRFVV